MNIVIGSDHGGFDLKETLKIYLMEQGHTVLDYGTYSKDSVDYPDIAQLVAQKVSEDGEFIGVIIDGAGMGSAMAANKVPGIRAAACYDTYAAGNSREHNDANVLTLGSMITGSGLAKEIVKKWIETSFGGGRHARRVSKIMMIEEKYLKK